jgi:hypothetical protein
VMQAQQHNSAVSSDVLLGPDADRLFRIAIGIGAIGVAASVLLGLVNGDGMARFVESWLMAFYFVVTIALGGMFFTFVQHATHAGWSVGVRRIAEITVSNFVWLWILFLPILFVALFREGKPLYAWMNPTTTDELYEHKAPYLNVPFWTIRAVLYFAVWAGFGWFFYRNSRRQDETGDWKLTLWMQRAAPLCAVLFALTLTFSAIDWVKSLDAHWFSTIFGVYVFAASCCGFFSFQIIVIYLIQRRGKVRDEITPEHFQDMGKQLFAFGVVFWAYIAYSQYMLIWYANIPEETTWYIARLSGAWKWVSLLLLVGHFALPFLLLITKHTKRATGVLAMIAGGMLLMHLVDIYWLTMPTVPAEALEEAGSNLAELHRQIDAGLVDVGWAPRLLDLTCLVGLVGLFVAGVAHRLRTCPLIPVQDPRLQESLAFENM